MRRLEEDLKQTEYDLAHITEFSIKYYERLLEKYGKGKERKTEIASFDTIKANIVAANNAKLYVNRQEGFIGYGLKKDEYVCECSDIDDIIVFRKDGKCLVSRIQDKVFVGKDIIHAGVFKKNDERMVYNLAYLDGKTGRSMVKRFNVLSVTRDKEYDLTKGDKKSKVLHFSANQNGEAEVISVFLTASSSARKKNFDFDFADIDIKGRGAGGNIMTRYPVRKVVLKSAGVSTLGGVDIWYDEHIGRLNRDERGLFLGNFKAEDSVIVFYHDGHYELTSFELTNHYEYKNIMALYKHDSDEIAYSAVYYDGDSRLAYVKRFNIETSSANKKFKFVSEAKNSKLLFVSADDSIETEVTYREKGKRLKKEVVVDQLIEVKGWKSVGNKFPVQSIVKIEQTNKPDPKKIDSDSLEALKKSVQEEVDQEDKDQLGLFDGGKPADK